MQAIKITNLDNIKAREFLLREDSFFNFELPPYFNFSNLIKKIQKILEEELKNNRIKLEKVIGDFKKIDDSNYKIFMNKDGRYSWRQIEIPNPYLYVLLVYKITEKQNWDFLVSKFKEFGKCEKIICSSIPVFDKNNSKNKKTQILNWLKNIEKESIKLSLEYDYLIETDISNFYPSIYTHSISWALYGKDIAKKEKRNNDLLGNLIDDLIQSMRYGETRGIPQGSILFDFISEIILGAIDLELDEKIKNFYVKILRYRDDYRIFVNEQSTGEKVLKILTEILSEYHLQLNSNKTSFSSEIIKSSFKEAKFSWILKDFNWTLKDLKRDNDLLKYFLRIYEHSIQFPNSGNILTVMSSFYSNFKRIKIKEDPDPEIIISILTEIAINNPKIYPVFAAYISKLLTFIKDDNNKKEIIKKIKKKFSKIPNIGYLEIWLQRISLSFKEDGYTENLCKLVNNEEIDKLWNFPENIKNIILKNVISKGKKDIKNKLENLIIDRKELEKIKKKKIIDEKEFNVFKSYVS
jgi:RNA-directed DNA polymerase